MRRSILGLVILSVSLPVVAFQARRSEAIPVVAPTNGAVPGGIGLLPGYQHRPGLGPDTSEGRIVKPKGLTIDYNLTCDTGSYVDIAKRDVKVLWSREQQVGGQPVQIALTSKKMLYVSYPRTRANFWTEVKSEQDVADVLLMVLTYRAAPGEK